MKIQKKKIFYFIFIFFFGGGGVGLGGQGGCELRSEAFVKIQKKIFFFGGGVGWGLGSWGQVGGIRVDGNREVKLV